MSATMLWMQRVLRPGANTPRDIQRDYLLLLSLGLLLIATGIGLRDPWPADEPRFALIARDMVMTGDWLLPRVGGDIYSAELLRKTSIQRVLYSLAAIIGGLCAGAVAYLVIRDDKRAEIIANHDIDPLGPLSLMAAAALIVCFVARPRRGLAAFGGVLASVLLIISSWVNPSMNSAQSGANFIDRVERVSDPARELGFIAFKDLASRSP